MKLIADRLLALSPDQDMVVEFARRKLLLPAKNHAITKVTPAACDRFVFDNKARDALSHLRRCGWKIDEIDIKPPLEECWIEIPESNCGWLIGDNYASFFVAVGRRVVHVGGLHIDLWNRDDVPCVRLTAAAQSIVQSGNITEAELARNVTAVAWLCASLMSSRTVTIEHKDIRDDKPQGWIRRREQRGVPIFSYNKATLVLPKTAIHRGTVCSIETFAGRRGHAVIGHWRLINREIEPIWIWIDGYRRGDDDLGYVVKERHVALTGGGLRRGCNIPSHVGKRGERVSSMDRR